jgi:predicted SAM-dependent methyltransferase
MRKIQFGCGVCPISDWENHDLDMDISNPLPIDSASVDAVFSEMTVEHITTREAWKFLEECHRILKVNGLIRMVIPDFVKCWKVKDPDWLKVNQGVTQNDGTMKEQYKSILFSHHHKSLWTSELMQAVLEVIGFQRVSIKNAFESDYSELRNLEQHHKGVGLKAAFSESGCVEGIKL